MIIKVSQGLSGPSQRGRPTKQGHILGLTDFKTQFLTEDKYWEDQIVLTVHSERKEK